MEETMCFPHEKRKILGDIFLCLYQSCILHLSFCLGFAALAKLGATPSGFSLAEGLSVPIPVPAARVSWGQRRIIK